MWILNWGCAVPKARPFECWHRENPLKLLRFTLLCALPGLMRWLSHAIGMCGNVLCPKNDPIGGCLVEANHRGYLSDRENEEEILLDVEIAAEAGVELYVIDAGWYGQEPNVWFDNVGDWYAAPWLPNDLYPIIDRARAKGMKFGLWMELEAVGRNAKLRQEHPDFIMRNGSDQIADGRVLDLSKPEVAAWVEEQVESVISVISWICSVSITIIESATAPAGK